MFLRYPLADRVRLVLEDKNVDYLYILIAKNLGISIEEAKLRYVITFRTVVQDMQVTGNMEDIYHLHKMILENGCPVQSVNTNSMILDLRQFIFNIK